MAADSKDGKQGPGKNRTSSGKLPSPRAEKGRATPYPPSSVNDGSTGGVELEPGGMMQVMGMGYSAPLPLASEFEHYEKVQPGAADRILTMAEKEQEARHRQDERGFKFAIRRVYSTALVSVVMLGVTAYGFYLDLGWWLFR